MPSALLHQQIALLELNQRLRDAERHHRLFRRSEPATTTVAAPARTASRTASHTLASADRPTARVIDLPAAPPSTTTVEPVGHPSSPARVA